MLVGSSTTRTKKTWPLWALLDSEWLKLFKISGKLFVTYTMVLMIYVMFSTKIPLVPVKNTAVMANSCLGNNKLFFIQIVHG